MSLETHERNMRLYAQDLALVQLLKDPSTDEGRKRRDRARVDEAFDAGCVTVSAILAYFEKQGWEPISRQAVQAALSH